MTLKNKNTSGFSRKTGFWVRFLTLTIKSIDLWVLTYIITVYVTTRAFRLQAYAVKHILHNLLPWNWPFHETNHDKHCPVHKMRMNGPDAYDVVYQSINEMFGMFLGMKLNFLRFNVVFQNNLCSTWLTVLSNKQFCGLSI